MENLYETLGVPKDATPDEIKAAHRRAAKKAHPDGGGSAEAFHAVQRALVVLSNPEKRAHYDRFGHAPQDEPQDLMAAQARSAVANKMAGLIQDPNINPATFDMVEAIRELLNADASMMSDQIAAIREGQERLRQFLKRLKRKAGAKGEDRLGQLLEGQINNGDLMVKQHERNLQTLAMAKEMVAEYLYEIDPPPVQIVTLGNPGFGIGGGSQWFGGNNTGGY